MRFRLILLLAAVATAYGQTGAFVPELAQLDTNLEQYRAKYKLPGVAVAVMRDGELVYDRGFGLARRTPDEVPVKPETLFRIASVSKPFTAVTMLKLREAGKVRLEDRVFEILPEFQPLLGDARMLTITVRDLLQHSGGWDSEQSGDPMFPDHETLTALEASFPPSLNDIVSFWLTQPLDFKPGTRHAYSNFGYALAGLVIERVSEMPYEDAVRHYVLKPLGITRMRVGKTFEAAENEAAYESLSGEDRGLSIFSAEPEMVPVAYGVYAIENLQALGGWLASASDVARLLASVETFLRPDSWQEFVARPAGWRSESSWYGLGIQVFRTPEGGYVLMHDGAIASTSSSLAVRGADGTAFAVLANAMFGDADVDERAGEMALDLLLAIAPVLER